MAFKNFHFDFFQRAVILQVEIIQKKICVCYFSMRNPLMKFQDDISLPHTYTHTPGMGNALN